MSISIPDHSAGKRYAWKLGANALGVPLAAFIQACSARLLGPTALGNFSFVTNAFAQLLSFLEAGSSEGLYTKLSQRPEERQLLRFYAVVVLLLFTLAITLTALVLLCGASSWLFPSLETTVIWLGLAFAFLMWITQVVQRVVDCYGLTVAGEQRRIAVRGISALLIGAMLLVVPSIPIELYFVYQLIILVLALLAWTNLLSKHGVLLWPREKLSGELLTRYRREFSVFSGPLLVYSAVSLCTGFFDRWYLQRVAGAEHQGYFALGNQIAMFCFVFSGAMAPIFIRELSRAYARSDRVEMRRLFDTLIPRLFSVTGLLGLFVALNAEAITGLLGGEKFEHAAPTVLVLALYPLHQTFGQLSGSLFYVTGQTKLYRNIGVTAMLAGVLLTVFLIGPANYGALELGSVGLAIKTVLLQLLVVFVQLWFNCRLIETSFARHLLLQFAVIIGLACSAGLARWISVTLFSTLIPQLLCSGGCYLLLSLALVVVKPRYFGFDNQELSNLRVKVLRILKDELPRQ